MPQPLALSIAWIAYGYLATGFLLLPWWHWRGLKRLDATASSGTMGFRILISGGLVLLWPWMLRRSIIQSGTPPLERTAHRDAVGASQDS
ncbi:MAG: hypothetical protein JNN01_20820 [Opitutaceae bacterium]|nr:hypothetical protein [Opitutaceae bacterium]